MFSGYGKPNLDCFVENDFSFIENDLTRKMNWMKIIIQRLKKSYYFKDLIQIQLQKKIHPTIKAKLI